MKQLFLLLFFAIFLSSSAQKKSNSFFTNSDKSIFTNSDKSIKVIFQLNDKKTPTYSILYQNNIVLNTSELGIIREDANFYTDLKVVKIGKPQQISDKYTMVQGKRKENSYSATQYSVSLENSDRKSMEIIFQLSKNGVALRYNFPNSSKDLKTIIEEKTTYNFNPETRAWLQPMSKAKTGWAETNPSYEEHYAMGIPVDTKPAIGEGWVYPALFETNKTWVLISETTLDNKYCGTILIYNDNKKGLQVSFPQKEEIFPNGGLNPQSTLPWNTPWRIISIGSLNNITESTLGTDLAAPSTAKDLSYIKSGLSSWSWVLLKDDFTNYDTTHKFIEYASEMKWPYCLIDADWDTKIGDEKIKELTGFAKTKNVKVLVWYNSSGSWNSTPYHPKGKLLTPEDREKEFTRLNNLGVAGIKIDFFGGDGQSMIAYYHDLLKDTAKHKLLINFHGATLPRGWQRTYPHLLTTEAIKGEEFITFDQKNADLQPSHCAVIPFTRNVYDPMDFTPMVLDAIPNITRKTTPAFELALPVLFLSGIQHIAETPTGMSKMPKYVVEYLKDIPTNWDDSKFLDGYPGKYIVMARKKDNIWHIVGINGENTPKEIEIDLSFVKNEEGFIILENENGFKQETVSKANKIKVQMKPNGGFVIKI